MTTAHPSAPQFISRLSLSAIGYRAFDVFALRAQYYLCGVYGIALAGWSSNNKYSLMGGLRASAQMISYELALGLGLIGVILQSGTLDLYSIVEQQAGYFGFSGWNVFWVQPLGFIIYMIAAIAETNRVPFDLPEAETELVAGFHTEYSAMKFALFFMAEYVNMFTVSMLATTLFLGGWNGPFVHQVPWLGVFYFLGKVVMFLFLYLVAGHLGAASTS